MAKNLNLGNFLTISKSNISKLQIFYNIGFIQIEGQKPRKLLEPFFAKNIKVSDFGLIWWTFREYLQIKIFFQNP